MSGNDDSNEDISTLFKNLQGNLSGEPLEIYVEIQKASGDLVHVDSDFGDEDDDDDNDIEERENEETVNEVQTGDKDNRFDKKALLATTYANGGISLDEFTKLLESESQKDCQSYEQISDPGSSFQKEFDLHQKRRRRKRKGQLPRHLFGLMGEANLRLARGEYEEATKMCMEIVRLAPTAPEPFQTLGMLYEEQGEPHRSLQFFLIAAYLSPTDVDEWTRLAEISVEQGLFEQAVNCYTRALKLESTNSLLHWERCNLYKNLGEKKKALDGFILFQSNIVGEDKGELYLKISREIAMCYHEGLQIPAGIETMKAAIEKYPNNVISEDINLYLELLMTEKFYGKVIEVMVVHCGVQFLMDSEADPNNLCYSEYLSHFIRCELPNVLPIDLRVKLILCMIHLKGFHLLSDIIQPLFEESIDDMGDLYLDVAEAYMHVGKYIEAIPLLSSLTKTTAFNVAAVWLKYGECLNAVGDIDNAVDAYKTVVNLAPSHVAARLLLSTSLQQLGRSEEALTTLPQGDDSESVLDLQLLYQRSNLLFSQKLWDEFVQTAKIILSHNMETLVNKAEERAILSAQVYRGRMDALQECRSKSGFPTSNIRKYVQLNDILPEEKWDLHLKICYALKQMNKLDELEKWSVSILVSRTFHKVLNKGKELNFKAFIVAYFNENWENAYNLLKMFMLQFMNSNRFWNLFSLVANNTRSVRHNKVCLRLSLKHQDHFALGILNGHSAMIAGSYKHALGEYMNAFKQAPKDPLVILCIALSLAHLNCQKYTTNKNSLIVQALAFFNQYFEERGACQESYYNLGRAMHQLGFIHAAVFYYKRVLETPPAIDDTPEDKEIFDLSNEAAFNLSLIYQTSGSTSLAKYYISKYCNI